MGFGFFVLVYSIAADNVWVSLAVIVTMAMITVLLGGLGFREYLSLLLIPALFAVFSGLAIAFSFSTQPSGDFCLNLGLFCLYATKGSLFMTARVIGRAFAAVSCMYMMSLSTPVNEIICVLQDLHLPTLFTELMNMIYRFIFILLDVQVRMATAARSRLGYIDLKTSWYSFASILSTLLIVSMKRANAYFDALESRGYDGRLRFLREKKTVKPKVAAAAAAYIAVLMILGSVTGSA